MSLRSQAQHPTPRTRGRLATSHASRGAPEGAATHGNCRAELDASVKSARRLGLVPARDEPRESQRA